MLQALIGIALAVVVAYAAYRAHALTVSGAIAAFVIGAITFGIGGWQATLVLFAFFIPSTLLSRVGKRRKRELVDVGKQGARDAWQVAANGGVAALAMLLSLRFGGVMLAAFAGAFAAASADTWGTEIGTLARGTPRSIFTFKPVPTGISGGITWQGTLAEFAGALLVGAVAAALHMGPLIAVVIGGIAGGFLDSALGATAQSLRYCPSCEKECETNPHVCGTPTVLRRGFPWLENDAVNFAATAGGAVVAALLCFLAFLSVGAAPRMSPLTVKPCTIGKNKLPAHCGALRVYENRDTHAGRTIEIHFIEVDAVHRTHHAIVFNPGGPGADDSSLAGYIANGEFEKAMSTLRDSYDLVFIDNRGTGQSHPLECSLYPNDHPEYYYKQLWPDTLLQTCRAQLTKTSDLNAYTTDATVADIDDVRAALQYPKLVLFGDSYGTMLYLDYARRYPSHVESIVLEGVAPPGFVKIPLQFAQGGQKAMDALIAACSKDVVCRSRFPHFADHFAAVMRRFDDGPLSVSIVNPATKRSQTVLLSKAVFADRLRDMLYANEAAAYVPYIIEQAYENNFVPAGRMVESWTDAIWRGHNVGLNLSVTCAEDIPFISEADVAKTSDGSFVGDSRVRAQQRACSIWNVKRASSDFQTPVRSAAPVLMFSGAEDPATPKQYGQEELAYLPNGRQILIPNATHETELDCEDDLIVTFVHTRDAKRLDATRCVGSSQRPPFATSMTGFP